MGIVKQIKLNSIYSSLLKSKNHNKQKNSISKTDMSIQYAYKNSHTRNSDTQLYMTKLKLTGSNIITE